MSDTSEPLITIGITCYSEGDWLLECWDSVLRQTDPRWRAVLVMDGTEHQRTKEVFASLEHPKLQKFAMPENQGPYPTRNKAFELTTTPFHFYLDGDDQLVPTSVSRVLATFERKPDAAFVYGDYQDFGDRSLRRRHRHHVTWDDFTTCQPIPGASVYRKDLWEKLGGFASELARGNGDYDFLIGALEAGERGYHCGDVIYRCRFRSTGKVSSSYDRRYHETHEIIVRRHPRFFADERRRNRFLALGYLRSAQANVGVDPVRGAQLAMRAIELGLRFDRRLWMIAAKACVGMVKRSVVAPPRT